MKYKHLSNYYFRLEERLVGKTKRYEYILRFAFDHVLSFSLLYKNDKYLMKTILNKLNNADNNIKFEYNTMTRVLTIYKNKKVAYKLSIINGISSKYVNYFKDEIQSNWSLLF